MKSAYVVLGIPGNANEEEIREAFERARAFYTKEKMVENPELMERYAELREAHKILTTPDLRQLHDRKLASGVVSRGRPTRIEVVEEQPSGMGTLKIMGVVVVLMFAIGTYYSDVRETARKERMTSGDYDVYYNGLLATVPDAGDMLATFALPGVYNATRWENPEVTQLLANADRTSGTERLALLEQAERIVMAEVPTIPTMFDQRRTLLAIEVGGWYADPLGRQSLKHLFIRSLPAEEPPERRAL